MIKNIIFDLGNVLVKVDLKKFKKAILSEGVDEARYDKFLGSDYFKKLIFRYETGKIKTKEFISICLKKMGTDMSQKRFIKHFNDMLVEKPEMKRFINDLKKDKRFNFLVLSNSNPLHWSLRKKNLDFILAWDSAVSYKYKLYKPDIRFYISVMKKYKFKPEETLYIDDHEINCLAARTLGINTIHFKNFSVFKKNLRPL